MKTMFLKHLEKKRKTTIKNDLRRLFATQKTGSVEDYSLQTVTKSRTFFGKSILILICLQGLSRKNKITQQDVFFALLL